MQAATPIDARIDLGQLARRARVPAAIAAVAIGAAMVIGGPARHLLDALERAFTADPRWVLAAAAFEALSFAGYIALLSHVAGRGNERFGLKQSYRTTLAGAAATRLLPTAGAGGAAVTLWVLRRSGHDGRAGVRTLLTFLVLLYAVFLAAIFGSGIAGAHGDTLLLGAIPGAAAGVAMLVAIGLGLHGRTVFGEAVRDAFALVRRPHVRLLGAFAWWGFDICVLWSVFQAVGSPPPVHILVLGYFLGQVANTIPVPGAASGGLVGVMLAFGVAPDVALAGVLAYRAIAIWLPAPFGAHALAGLKRDAARWTAEDGPMQEAPVGKFLHAPQPLAA